MANDLTPAAAVANLKRLLTRDAEDGYGNVVVKFAERQELHDALNLLLADHARLILALGEAEQDRDTLAARVNVMQAALHRIAYEPFGAADASDREVLADITAAAVAALNLATSCGTT